MRFGVVIERMSRDELEEFATVADATGFEVIVVPGGETGWRDPLVVAEFVGMLAPTPRILVEVHPGLDHPLLLAESLASLDAATKGRLEVIASIATVALFEERGIDAADAATRHEEALDVIRSAWRCLPFRHEGRHWTIPARLELNGPRLPNDVQMTTRPNQFSLPIWRRSNGKAGHVIDRDDGIVGATVDVQRDALVTLDAVRRASEIGVDVVLCQFDGGERDHAIRMFSRAIAPRFRAAAIPLSIIEQLDEEVEEFGGRDSNRSDQRPG